MLQEMKKTQFTKLVDEEGKSLKVMFEHQSILEKTIASLKDSRYANQVTDSLICFLEIQFRSLEKAI
jgi:hypothetical protein